MDLTTSTDNFFSDQTQNDITHLDIATSNPERIMMYIDAVKALEDTPEEEIMEFFDILKQEGENTLIHDLETYYYQF